MTEIRCLQLLPLATRISASNARYPVEQVPLPPPRYLMSLSARCPIQISFRIKKPKDVEDDDDADDVESLETKCSKALMP